MPDLVGHDGKRVGSDNKTDGMNRHIYRLVAAVLAAITIVSCKDARNSETYRLLEDVDSYIEARPDSALAVLEGIDVEDLGSREEKAKYALLMSMALDKNYIDRTDFEVLQPAIDYYEDHGTVTDKLRTFYYQGRIYQNGGDDEMAMECFVRAVEEGDGAEDCLTLARIYFAQGNIYSNLYNWDKYIKCNIYAADNFKKAGLTNSYANSLLRVINGYTLQKEYDKAFTVVEDFKSVINNISVNRLGDFYVNYLLLLVESKESKSVVTEKLNEYFENIPTDYIEWLSVSLIYSYLENYDKALEALNGFTIPEKTNNKIRYYAILSEAYKHKNKPTEALEAFEKYVALTDSVEFRIFEQDTQFIEEHHQLELKALQEKEAKTRTALICIIALLVALIAIYLIRKQLKIRTAEKKQLEIEKKRYEQLYADAIAERDALTKMIEDSSVKDETKAVIRERLEVLNKVIISHITDTSSANKKAFQELEALVADRDSFIESTRLTIEGNNPEFIAALKKQGLTDEEINICCLYVIGLKGKDIKAYTSQPRHYNQSADIRHKLGLTENDTNLSIFLREMLEK